MAEPAVLLEAAQAVLAAAQDHKRAASYHRKRASELMARFGRLQRLCAEHGVHIQINEGEDPRRSRPQ